MGGSIIHAEDVEQESVHVGLFLDDLGGGLAEAVPGLCLYSQQDRVATSAGCLERRAKFCGVCRYDAIIGIRAEDEYWWVSCRVVSGRSPIKATKPTASGLLMMS